MACWTLWISDSWFSKGFWSEEIKIRVYWDQKKDTHLSATAQEVSRYSKIIWVLWSQMEDTLSLHKLFIWSYIFKFQIFGFSMVSRGILRILNHFWFLLKLLLEAWYFQLDWKFHFAIFNAKINELSIYHLLIPMIQDFKWWLITNIFIQTRKKIFLLWFISIVLQFSKRILNFKKEFFLMWTFWEKYLINMWPTYEKESLAMAWLLWQGKQ